MCIFLNVDHQDGDIYSTCGYFQGAMCIMSKRVTINALNSQLTEMAEALAILRACRGVCKVNLYAEGHPSPWHILSVQCSLKTS